MPAAARPPPGRSQSHPRLTPIPSHLNFNSARVCTLSHNITQFERRKGRSAGPAAAGAAARQVPVTSRAESESVQVPARPGAGRPGAPGPSRAAFRLTISGRPSVAVRVTGTVTVRVRGPPSRWHWHGDSGPRVMAARARGASLIALGHIRVTSVVSNSRLSIPRAAPDRARPFAGDIT